MKSKRVVKAQVQSVVSGIFEINGYGCVLSQVQNYYPVEIDKPGMYCWGFKYNSGIFEFFYHSVEDEAIKERLLFITALERYWAKR